MQAYTPAHLLCLCSFVFLTACASYPKGSFTNSDSTPDYSDLNAWAAHPEKSDQADLYPDESKPDSVDVLEADIFFVHPTTYTGKPIKDQWNAPINDLSLNKGTDESSIKYQASIFNKAGRVFAPRYRQAHLRTYYTKDSILADQVFELAYQDVRNAFSYYLRKFNNGRPFIIASHSQGTTHSKRLIQEEINGTELKNQMVVAYLVGMPVFKDTYNDILPCQNQSDINCFISWRTFKRGHSPKDIVTGDNIIVHNPLSWRMDDSYVPKEENEGAILRNFNKIIPEATDAQVQSGILWAVKPKFPLSFLFTRKNYHIADYNFYYMNVRNNAQLRVNRFLDQEEERRTGSTR